MFPSVPTSMNTILTHRNNLRRYHVTKLQGQQYQSSFAWPPSKHAGMPIDLLIVRDRPVRRLHDGPLLPRLSVHVTLWWPRSSWYPSIIHTVSCLSTIQSEEWEGVKVNLFFKWKVHRAPGRFVLLLYVWTKAVKREKNVPSERVSFCLLLRMMFGPGELITAVTVTLPRLLHNLQETRIIP